MTTRTLPARPGHHDALRPVPWRRMAWVTWRQHQLALAGVAVLFGVAALYLVIAGLQMHHAYAAVAACRPAGSVACQGVAGDFLNTYAPGAGPVLGLLQVIPALIGAFLGAPLLARELEIGNLPLRLDPGLRAGAVDRRQAGAARGCGRCRGRSVQRARLLVRTAALGSGRRQRPAVSDHLRPARCCARRLDAGRVRDRRPGRRPDPTGDPGDVRCLRRVWRACLRDRGVPAPVLRSTADQHEP